MYALSRIKRHHFWKTLTQARLLTWTKTEDNILKTKEQLVYPQEDLFTFLTKQFQQYGERTAVVRNLSVGFEEQMKLFFPKVNINNLRMYTPINKTQVSNMLKSIFQSIMFLSLIVKFLF